MKTLPTRKDESLLLRLAENDDDSATIALLVTLCRQSPKLRHWLWEDFGRDAKTRARFAALVAKTGEITASGFLELTDDAAALREEQRRLRAQISPACYGGLTWGEVVALIRHYQAGTLDQGVFLLAHDWRASGRASPGLMWAGIEFLQQVLPSGRRRLLKHLEKSLTFLKRYENTPRRRGMIGHADWWKLHTLFYILKNPREAYRTRDLRGHLAELGLEINVKEMQRFCVRHSIQRDMRAGRPRTRKTPRAN